MKRKKKDGKSLKQLKNYNARSLKKCTCSKIKKIVEVQRSAFAVPIANRKMYSMLEVMCCTHRFVTLDSVLVRMNA